MQAGTCCEQPEGMASRPSTLTLLAAAFALCGVGSAFQPPSASSPPPRAPTLDRRDALQRIAGAAAGAVAAALVQPRSPAASAAEPREAIAKAASKLPGYGPPDTLFPAFFAGDWVLTREGAGLTVAAGQEGNVDPEDLAQAKAWGAEKVRYPVRFLPYDDAGAGSVIADRAYNENGLWRARFAGKSDLYLEAITPRWDRSNPNVLTVSFPDGLVREVKVTKRSYEAPAEDAFGLSEFCRIAEAKPDTNLASVPRISAVRVLQRWKRTGPDTVEGLELIKYYPPVSLAADPPAAMTLKARLRLERAR